MASALAVAIRRVTIDYRRARAEDIGAVNAIYHEAQTEGDAYVPPVAETGLPIFRHELAQSEMWVAAEATEVVAFATTVERGSTAFLAELFVRADRRSHGIGRGLLARCFDDRGRQRSTLGSPDPRALALYVGLGLDPRWPFFHLVASPSPVLRPASPQRGEVSVHASETVDDELIALDAKISGRRRPQDLEYWRSEGRAVFLRFTRLDATVGYAVVRRRSDDWVGNEDAITIGPAGSFSPEHAAAVVRIAVSTELDSGQKLRVGLPGPHPALRALLTQGFEIGELDTFLAAPGSLPFDPVCYVPSGGALF